MAVPVAQGYPAAGPLEALPNELRLSLDTPTGQATCLAALSTLQPAQGLPWPNTIVARNHHYYCLPSEHARRLAEEGTTTQGARSVYSLALSPCKCKAKTAIVTNTAPEPAHIITLEQSNFGLAALVPDTIQLGLVVRGRIQGQTDIDKEAHPGPPDLFGRTTFPDHGGILTWVAENAPKPLAEIFKKATASAIVLLNTLRLTTVSIRQRAIFYGTYCLSKFTYVASYAASLRRRST